MSLAWLHIHEDFADWKSAIEQILHKQYKDATYIYPKNSNHPVTARYNAVTVEFVPQTHRAIPAKIHKRTQENTCRGKLSCDRPATKARYNVLTSHLSWSNLVSQLCTVGTRTELLYQVVKFAIAFLLLNINPGGNFWILFQLLIMESYMSTQGWITKGKLSKSCHRSFGGPSNFSTWVLIRSIRSGICVCKRVI